MRLAGLLVLLLAASGLAFDRVKLRANRARARIEGDNTEGLDHALADIEDLKEAMRDVNRRLNVVGDASAEVPITVEVNNKDAVEIANQAVDEMNRDGTSPDRLVLVSVLSASWTGSEDSPTWSVVISVAPTRCKNPYRFAVSPLEDFSAGTPECAKNYHVTDVQEVPLKALLRPPEVFALGGPGRWYIAHPDGKHSDIQPIPTTSWWDGSSPT
jgi:hypothetical protein